MSEYCSKKSHLVFVHHPSTSLPFQCWLHASTTRTKMDIDLPFFFIPTLDNFHCAFRCSKLNAVLLVSLSLIFLATSTRNYTNHIYSFLRSSSRSTPSRWIGRNLRSRCAMVRFSLRPSYYVPVPKLPSHSSAVPPQIYQTTFIPLSASQSTHLPQHTSITILSQQSCSLPLLSTLAPYPS